MDGIQRPRSSPGAPLSGMLLLALMLVALLLRLPGLEELSITLEEYACIYHLDAPGILAFIERQRAHYPYGAPLVPVLQYGWAHGVGGGIVSLRTFSLIATLLIVPMLYFLTQRFFAEAARGRVAGLIAALCAALSHVHIYHGQEARMYAFLALFALVSVYGFVRAVQGGPRYWWVLNICANALVIWTHLFGVLLVAAEGVVLLLAYRSVWRLWLGWGTAHLLPLAPLALWILLIPPQPPDLTGYYGAPTAYQIFWDIFGDDVVFRASLGFAAPPVRDASVVWWAQSYPAVEWGLAALFAMAALWLMWRFVHAPGGSARATSGFMLLWLFLPIGLLVGISYLWTPVYSSRYTVHSVYPLYIGLGGLISALPRRNLVALAAIVLAAVYVQQFAFAHTRPVRTQWKAATAVIAMNAGPQDILLVEDFFWLPLIKINHAGLALPTAAALERATLQEMAAEVASTPMKDGVGRVWVLLVDTGRYPPGSFVESLREAGIAFEHWRYPGERPLELFRIDAAPARVAPLPEAPWPLAGLARALEHSEDAPHVAALRRAVFFHPDTMGGPWLRLGLEAGARGDAELAAHLLARAAALNPQYALHLALLEEALTGRLPADAQPHATAAKAHARGDYPAARAALGNAVAAPGLTRWMRWNVMLSEHGATQTAAALSAEIEADARTAAWLLPIEPFPTVTP
jgi:hypothetical protein